jgi:hypothetical protein
VAYLLNTTLITVFYHRGLAHRAVVLRPGARQFAATTDTPIRRRTPIARCTTDCSASCSAS